MRAVPCEEIDGRSVCSCPGCGRSFKPFMRGGDPIPYRPGMKWVHRCDTPPPGGAGSELKALLARIGIVATPGCSCNKRARTMDEQGCDWCEQHIDQIDAWLAEEAKKRKLPYLSLAGKALIRLAIRRARKKGISR